MTTLHTTARDLPGVSTQEFSHAMARFAPLPDGRFALAVSGGPDSTALALLAKEWCDAEGRAPPVAFIVDHGLRAESAAESAIVKIRLLALGIETEILTWQHATLAAALQQEARRGRYRLLLEACQAHGISCLMLAHQRDDQAETLLMRFAKGSGIDGLAGMPADSMREGIRLLRPLLDFPKERLIATCHEAGVDYVTDPSNSLEKFARGRLRKVMPVLAAEGLTVERLIDCSRRAAEARDALHLYTMEFLREHSRRDPFGVVHIDRAKLLALPRAVALRALAKALQNVHAEDYAPAHASLALLLEAVTGDSMPSRTLNGCRIGLRQGHVAITREAAPAAPLPIRAGESVIWDRRWRVTLGQNVDHAYEVRALGNPPHDVLDRLAPDLRRKVPQGRVRAVLPALWRQSEIALIPFFGESLANASLTLPWPPSRAN